MVIDGIALLQQASDTLAELDPECLSDDELRETLVAWHRAEARLVAAKARITAAFDIRGAYRVDGSKSAAAWLARRCHTSARAARAQTRLARRLRHMPYTRDALAEGDIDERHAEVLAGLCDSPRSPVAEAFPDAEAQLVEHARSLGFDEFVTALRYWESLVDQDGGEDQAASDHASRHLHLSETFRGNWVLDGQLDAVAGTELATALHRIDKELFDADWAEAKAVHGEDTRPEHLARSPRQRRADALVEMARRAVTTPAGGQPPRPLLVIHLGDESLTRLCELATGTVLTPGQLMPLITRADIERIVYAGPSRRVVDLGQRTRLFQGPLRRAILLRDRRCQHPGCKVPAEDCQVDHVVPYSKGGPTSQANGRAACDSHNHHKGDTHPSDYPGYDHHGHLTGLADQSHGDQGHGDQGHGDQGHDDHGYGDPPPLRDTG